MASSSSNVPSNHPKFLVLELRGELIGIDFEQLVLRFRLTHPAPPPVPASAPIHFKMNLLKQKGLVGLKHAILGSNVHLLGGEKLRRQAIPQLNYLSENWDNYLGSSGQVFDLLPQGYSFGVELSCTIPPMHHPKGSPLVGQIEGKIYVLQGKTYFRLIQPKIDTTFEVYYPRHETWEVLPDPPPYRRNRDIFGHFVLGHKFFVFADSMKIYFFDTHTRRWEESPQAEMSFRQTNLVRPTKGICVTFFPQLSNDEFQLMLVRDIGDAQVYALVLNSSMGQLLCYQPLREVFSEVRQVAAAMSFQNHFFFVLPNNDICVVWAGCDEHERLRLFISIFALQPCFNSVREFLPVDAMSSSSPPPPVEIKFLEVRIVHKLACIVDKDEEYSNYVNDAFLF